jgi:hypothetical protein
MAQKTSTTEIMAQHYGTSKRVVDSYQCTIKVMVHCEATIKIGAQNERIINANAASRRGCCNNENMALVRPAEGRLPPWRIVGGDESSGLLCDLLPCQIGQSAVLRVVRAAIKELGQGAAIGYEGDTVWGRGGPAAPTSAALGPSSSSSDMLSDSVSRVLSNILFFRPHLWYSIIEPCVLWSSNTGPQHLWSSIIEP